jgi:tetratricopeptide (TPR) repeat protein
MLGSRVNPWPRLRLSRLLLVGVVLSTSALAQRANARVPQNPPLSQEFDLPSYEAELDRYAAEIKRPETIPQLRASLPRIWFVRTTEGRMDISTAWLAQRLEKLENDPVKSNALVSQIGTRLAAMRESAKELEAASQQPSADSAREQYKKIMQRSEFAGQQGPSQWDRMWDKIGQWISDQFLKLMRALHLGRASGNVLAWIVVGLAFLALSYFVYRNLEGRARLPESANEASPDLSDSRQWARDALAAAERGDYREAVHCAYWASIVRLESLGLLKRDRARTPRESLRLLDPHPSEQKILSEFTRHFELIWYGYRPASAQDWSDARAHLEKMGCLAPSTLATANS